MRVLRYGAIGACIVALVLVASGASSAPSKPIHLGPAGPAGTTQKASPTALKALKLKKTFISAGFSGASLTPGGFTPIDAANAISCPGHTTCTVEATLNVQAQGVGSSNAWAICAELDTTFASCPYLGFLSSTFFQAGTFTETFTGVTPGPHTIQTSVFTSNGGTAYNYEFTYRTYNP